MHARFLSFGDRLVIIIIDNSTLRTNLRAFRGQLPVYRVVRRDSQVFCVLRSIFGVVHKALGVKQQQTAAHHKTAVQSHAVDASAEGRERGEEARACKRRYAFYTSEEVHQKNRSTLTD